MFITVLDFKVSFSGETFDFLKETDSIICSQLHIQGMDLVSHKWINVFGLL